MSSAYDGDASRLTPKARSTRSHSLKPPSQPVIFKRSKRTMSLPSKPVLLPLINVQRPYDNWGDESQENEDCQRNKEEMAWYTPVLGLSCSLAIYFWACALAYFSKTSWQPITFMNRGQKQLALRRPNESAVSTEFANNKQNEKVQRFEFSRIAKIKCRGVSSIKQSSSSSLFIQMKDFVSKENAVPGWGEI